jgi:hypothetical protein
MLALAEEFHHHALMATVEGKRSAVSPADLVVALRARFGIHQKAVKVEVCAPPSDFLVRFVSSSDYECVLHTFRVFKCYGKK